MAQSAREVALNLPAHRHAAEIVDAVRRHQVVVVEGPTGSGKTTQVPQLLADAGITDLMIGVTQPRRIAAVSVAWRIAAERDVELGQEVGYAIRFDDKTSDKTQIKIMTDGLLLQEARTDHDFGRYGVIIVDEAHERTLNIDFTLGLLQRALLRRADLRVVVSSATLDPRLFQRFFGGLGKEVPLVSIDSRPFPVDIRWRPQRSGDFDELIESVCRTVQRIHEADEEGDVLVFLAGAAAIRRCEERLTQLGVHRGGVILPLFGGLTRDEQERIFSEMPGLRKIVLSTNIAETSVTVPGVRHVIDTGRVKVMHVQPKTGVRTLREELVSQASADQRAGRAGRTAPGTCTRLYSEHDYEERPKFAVEEVLRLDLREVVLRLVDLGVTDIETFALPRKPPRHRLKLAIEQLMSMDAIDVDRGLTSVGRRMVPFPLSPSLARAVIAAADEHPDVVDEVLLVCAALSGRQPWVFTPNEESAARSAHRRFHHPLGDALTMIELVKAFLAAGDKTRFCTRNHVDPDLLAYIVKSHGQLCDVAESLGIRVVGGGAPSGVVKSLARGHKDNVLMGSGRNYESVHGLRCSIHPGSSLWRSEQRFVLSTDLIVLRRPYAAQVSVLRAEWLAALFPDLASQWGLRAPRSPLHKRNVERAELPSHVVVGGVELSINVQRGKAYVDIPAEHVEALLRVPPRSLDADVARLKSSIHVGDYRFSPGVPLGAQLGQLAWMPLPEPDADLRCVVPEGALLDFDRNLHTIERHVDELMAPMLPSKGKRPGWCCLVANGVGSYWFEVIPGFRDAVSATALSLEDLIDRLDGHDDLIARLMPIHHAWSEVARKQMANRKRGKGPRRNRKRGK